ncbi:phosphotransferase enzyme family protein [Patulibacter defluvii]|uniref:phosphotransferase enzyme family protein n=1 Tax=Patulibacter defluvii TaxID=3095358 RepID=UPI002A765F5A|nr:phosphotransferase [Patulibacter sp. DM4]
MSAIRIPWEPERAAALAERVRGHWDLGPEPARLLRLGTNASFRIGTVVIRIGPAGGDPAGAARELQLARFLADRDVPAARPEGRPPAVVDGHPVSAWRWIEHDPAATVDGRAFGTLLRRFHDATTDYDGPLPGWPQPRLIGDRIAALRRHPAFTEAEVDRLQTRLDGLLAALAEHPSPALPIHGDAHPGNVIVGPDGPVLLDFDLVCRGPRPWDLAPAALHAERYAGGSPAWFAALREGYGPPRDPAEPLHVRLRELASAAWLLAAETAPDRGSRSAEADVRLRAFGDDPDPPPWDAH